MEGRDSPGRPSAGGEQAQAQVLSDRTNLIDDRASSAVRAPQTDGADEYYGQLVNMRRKEDREFESALDESMKSIRYEHLRLVQERTELSERLLAVREACEKAERRMAEREAEHQRQMEKVMMERRREDTFYQSRGMSVAPMHSQGPSLANSTSNGGFRMSSSVSNGILPSIERYSVAPDRRHGGAPVPVPGATVVSHTGRVIGTIHHIATENRWITEILKLPIQHEVTIRSDRTFELEHLDAVHDPDDTKATKWLSLMIQATGERQQQPCTSCSNSNGIFSHCTTVGSELFPRCGNCEWSQTSCDAAHPADGQASLSLRPHLGHGQGRLPAATSTPTRVSSGFTAVNNSTPAGDFAASTGVFSSKPKPRRSLPNARGGNSHMSTPIAATDVAESSYNGAATASPGVQMDDAATPKSFTGQEPEITPDTLDLRHDGTVFTEPEVMEGVPVAKIDHTHAYWDPKWRTIEDTIGPKLRDWEAKLESAQQGGAEKSAKFLANRQVNRGRAVLDFLRNGEIHPYQLVRKELIHQGFTNYDTIYRLVGTLTELRKFNLSVTPLEWMRQRVHENYIKEPDKFRLEVMIKNMYHDDKLQDLRLKGGFGNIGRPSGLKQKMKRLPPSKAKAEDGSEKGSEKRKSAPGSARTSPKKRKTSAAQVATNRTDEGSDGGEDVQEDDESNLASGLPLTADRLRSLDDGTDMQDDEDDAASAYTDADSFCGAETRKWDWRLAQVKTDDHVSNDGITQYWNFKPDDDLSGGGKFEHQVLREVNPASWGVYKPPIDFHVHTNEITDVEVSKQSLEVAVHVNKLGGRKGGDILARFKRPRTMNRWLNFMMERRIPIGDVTEGKMKLIWDAMRPPEELETDAEDN